MCIDFAHVHELPIDQAAIVCSFPIFPLNIVIYLLLPSLLQISRFLPRANEKAGSAASALKLWAYTCLIQHHVIIHVSMFDGARRPLVMLAKRPLNELS